MKTMMMRSNWTACALIIACAAAAAAIGDSARSYDISWTSTDGGGGMSAGGVLELSSTIGQPDATTTAMTGGDFALVGGFWVASGPIAPPCPPDVNGDEVVDVLDLLAVIAAWGNPGGPEDINGDGIVDVLDLLAVIAAWGPCE